MCTPLPQTLPPPSLQARALPILLQRLTTIPLSEHPTLIPLLAKTTHILASDRLRLGTLSTTTLLPLQIALHLSSAKSLVELPLPLLLDLTISYPAHRDAIFLIWSHAFTISPPSTRNPPDVGESDSEDEGETVLSDLIQSDFIPGLVSRIQNKPTLSDMGIAAMLFLGVIRAHEELLATFLSEADYVLPALKGAYDTLSSTEEEEGSQPSKESVRIKEMILLFCMELIRAVKGESVKEGLKRLAGVPVIDKGQDGSKGFLKTNGLGEDLGVYLSYEGKDTNGAPIDGEVRMILEDIADDEARGDPRVQSILALFPSLPPSQLLLALNHPSYATSSTSTPEIQASPLLEVILSGGSSLPSELVILKQAVQAVSEQQGSISISNSSPTPTPTPGPSSIPSTYVRANIHDTPLDMSRLTIRSTTDEPTPLALAPGVGKDVSDEMRAKIHRLVERQRIEADEKAKAIADAGGLKYKPERYGYDDGMEGDILLDDRDEEEEEVDEEDLGVGAGVKGRATVTGNEGDESGEEENGENIVHTRKTQKEKLQKDGYDVTIQTKLELAYLADSRVFDRDGETRRSAARAKLRTATGMDDSQLEGWRIMLDRNIHKDAILGRHTFVPSKNLDYVMDDTRSTGSGGSHRGGRGGGRGGGGGSNRGGDGSSVGGDSSGGRGGSSGGNAPRVSKGSRGHSNAARTRGHDKKMSRMGAGA